MGDLILRDKPELKEKAVALRQRGFTYSEILKEVPVVKSTLSLWLREVGLAKAQMQRITEKKRVAQRMGGAARRNKRIRTQSEIWSKAQAEVGHITDRELWLIGTALYWAEGSKEKSWKPGLSVSFTNMDVDMVRVFMKWLEKCGVQRKDITFSILLHKSREAEVEHIIEYWSKVARFRRSELTGVYLKRALSVTKRKNVGDGYHGVLKVRVKKSSELQRKIKGWTNGLIDGITNSSELGDRLMVGQLPLEQ